MHIADAHCHFFSQKFFQTLIDQSPFRRKNQDPLRVIVENLGWEVPGTPRDLAARWVRELDQNHVSRCALIGSVPGDETSVEEAVMAFPERFIGYSMFDPSTEEVDRLTDLLARGAVRVIALFPAMHGYRLDGDRVMRVFETVHNQAGTAVFVHCGLLTVGIRTKLGMPSHFDIRLGNPLDLQRVASAFPDLPILIPHFGAGYLQEALMLAKLHANVYFDTSSSNRWIDFHPGLTLHQVFETFLSVVGPLRLIFGSDSSFFPRGWQSQLYAEQSAILHEICSSEDANRVFCDNFTRLFPMPC